MCDYLHDNVCWICRHPITCESETNESREELKKLNDAMTKEDFILLKGVKMRDHCHVTGNYRGPAHRECKHAWWPSWRQVGGQAGQWSS